MPKSRKDPLSDAMLRKLAEQLKDTEEDALELARELCKDQDYHAEDLHRRLAKVGEIFQCETCYVWFPLDRRAAAELDVCKTCEPETDPYEGLDDDDE